MKARVPQLSKRQEKLARQEIDFLVEKAWREKEDQVSVDLTRRILKTLCRVLYTEFGWGRTRLIRLINAFTKCMEESDTDEVYWEHTDRIVMDHLGLDFKKRDYTENGKVVTYDD